MWLSGTLQLSGEDTGRGRESSVTLLPEFGYYLNGNWSVGGRVGFTSTRTEQANDTRRETQTSIVPFARYVFAEPGNFRLFAQGELPVNIHGGRDFDGSSMDVSSTAGLNLRPGLHYAINERWGFNMLMPSVFTYLNDTDGDSFFEFGINDGYTVQQYLLSTNIGFTFTLR